MTSHYSADASTCPIIGKVKQCVAVDYVPVSEWREESSLTVLSQHSDSFEWMDISMAIPLGSEREYRAQEATNVTGLKPRAR